MTAGHRFGQRAVRRAAGLLAALLLVLACGAAETRAAEEILGFESHIEVRSDGTLVVTETIAVRAEGHEIRRGIYRDIPTVRYDQSGLRHTAGLTVIDVLRDGRPTPWHSERQGDGIRIYIGEESTWLDPGRYTYTIRYETTRQLGHFDDFDELYWNVTGNFWSFPIRRAVARVDLPAGAEVLRHAAYTGGFGGRGTDWRASEGLAHDIVFETTRPLGAREGLPIAVPSQTGPGPAP